MPMLFPLQKSSWLSDTGTDSWSAEPGDEDDDSEEMGSIDGESDENTNESTFWRDVAQAGKPNGDIRSFMVLKDSDMVLGSQRPIPIQTVACKASKL